MPCRLQAASQEAATWPSGCGMHGPAAQQGCVHCRQQQKRQEWAAKGHGEYREVEERDFFKVCAGHAWRPVGRRCGGRAPASRALGGLFARQLDAAMYSLPNVPAWPILGIAC
jgi:hypothetical protein